MSITHFSRRRALAFLLPGALVAALALIAVPLAGSARADGVSQTFNYSSGTQQFTVPAGITQLTVSLLGGEGGLGGADSTGPLQGGYRGAVTGTLAVTPGEVLTIGVGHGGSEGASRLGSAPGGVGGTNPISGYSGGTGGVAGDQGSSGGGGGGGAATVIQAGGQTIVAGGGGGGGGSGQFAPTAGQPGASSFTAAADPTTGNGQAGISTNSVCVAGIRCDGGASGAGGGGAIGGGPGAVAYGAGTSTEYFGYGGSPGANDATGLTSGTSVYQYYATDDADGSVTITYDMSAPGVPTGVSATAADGSAGVSWLAPLSTGGSAITDYLIQYAVVSGSPTWLDFTDGVSTDTSATVTGLTDGTAYEFRVAAVNTFGTSGYSAASSGVTPSTVPDAPTLTELLSSDGTLTATFSTVTATSPVTGYQYRLGTGSWIAAGTTSPISIGGLANGTTYTVVVRAINAIGAGAASNALSGTPLATPSAPTITSVSTGIGTASVSFTAGNAGGSPITNYEYSLDSGPWTSIGSTSSPFGLTGLGNGTSHTISLRGMSNAGAGAESAPSSFVPPSTPGAPTVGIVSAGDGTLSVNFAAGNNGGLAISGYEYQLTTGGAWTHAPTMASPLALGGLSNGTTYQVTLRADNQLGAGTASNTVAATPRTTPGAPALLAGSVASGNQELDASFTPPISDGGSAIVGYDYSTDGGVTWRGRTDGTTASPLVITALSSDGVTPLVNGTTYSVEVRAVNAVGAGTSSGVAQGIARTVPDAPTLATVTSLPTALQVHFTSASNGGSPITGYQYRLGTGAWTSTGTLAESFTISGLTDGTTYSVQVRAVNAVGAGSASSSLSGTPASQPGQASITSMTPGNASLTVGTSVSSTGGNAITSWQYSTDGGTTWSAGSASPVSITTQSNGSGALINGVSYSIAVRAVNAVGTGAASSTQLGIPMTTPGSPTIALTPADSSISVSYTAGSSGGSSITGVEYSLNGGGWTSVGSLQGSFIIGALTNGTAYGVQVRLVNGVGAGAASATSSETPRTVPDAPTWVAASPDGGQATASWLAPATGGSPITGYTATAWSASAGGTSSGTCTTAGLNCVITGLTNTVAYYVSVTAYNVAGASAASSPRVAVIPLAKPSAPTISGITAANTYLSVAFTAGSAGSSAISGYEYSLNGVDWISTGSQSSPFIISGLSNGTTYSVALRALNQSGAGASSAPRSGTPFGIPDVPDAALISATPQNGSALVNWVAPRDNGSAITGYTVVAWSASFQGSQVRTCTTTGSLSCTLSSLSNGTTYYVTVDATNAAGTTTRSTPRVAVTPGAPGAVTALAAVVGDSEVDLSWAAGSAGSSAITGYTVWYAPVGTSTFTQFGGTITGTSAAVTGLSDGTVYTFDVYAINSYGVGQAAVASPYTPVGPGIVPTFTTPVSTVDGFTASISPYDAATGYTVTTDVGTASVSGSTITVSGLTAGQQATVIVTATDFGRTTVQGTLVGSALLAGSAPQLGTPIRTADGYTVTLLNPVDVVTYTPSVSVGSVSMSGNTVTVSGLSPAQISTLTVTATRPGYAPASSQVSAAALGTGILPILSSPIATDDGFVVTILNPDLNGSYQYTLTAGAVTVVGTTITVTGLSPMQSATLSVVAQHVGFTDASQTADGVALGLGADLTVSPLVRTVDGFTFTLVGYDPSFAYDFTTDVGSVSFRDGVVTVTGLQPGQIATVSINATQTGDRNAHASVSGSPLIATGAAPVLTTPISLQNGFTTTIANYSPVSSYSASASVGHVSQTGAVVTVTGLTAGQSAAVTVSVARVGYTTRATSITGYALAAVPPPSVPDGPPSQDIAPGTGQVWSGNSVLDSTTTTGPHSETVKSGLFWLTVHSTTYPTASGHVVIAEGGQGTATVSGFQPGSDVTVWVFSTKTELATPRVGADGAATGLFVLPAQIKAGNHTIVVTGIAATGETVTLKLGFEVTAPGSSLSPKGGLATLLNETTKPNDGLGRHGSSSPSPSC